MSRIMVRLIVIVGILAIVPALLLMASPAAANSRGELDFRDIPAKTSEFIGYYKTIKLTPQQEKLKNEVLGSMPAVCCSDFTAATCCCPCNFSKALWGMSNYLVAKKGYNEAQLRAAVDEWIKATNPNGYSGTACSTGGCERPFAKDGCGGMVDDHLVF